MVLETDADTSVRARKILKAHAHCPGEIELRRPNDWDLVGEVEKPDASIGERLDSAVAQVALKSDRTDSGSVNGSRAIYNHRLALEYKEFGRLILQRDRDHFEGVFECQWLPIHQYMRIGQIYHCQLAIVRGALEGKRFGRVPGPKSELVCTARRFDEGDRTGRFAQRRFRCGALRKRRDARQCKQQERTYRQEAQKPLVIFSSQGSIQTRHS